MTPRSPPSAPGRRWPIAAAVTLSAALAAPAPAAEFSDLGEGTRSWSLRDGLPQATVTALAESRDGYLWVGTDAGLARHARGWPSERATGLQARCGREPEVLEDECRVRCAGEHDGGTQAAGPLAEAVGVGAEREPGGRGAEGEDTQAENGARRGCGARERVRTSGTLTTCDKLDTVEAAIQGSPAPASSSDLRPSLR